MAIYLNEKVLKADPKGNKIEREYYEGLQKVGELFNKFRIKGEDTSYIQITHSDPTQVLSMTGKKQKRRPTIALPVTLPYYDDELGAITIRYSTAPPERGEGGKLTWATKYIEFRGALVITDKQKDLAWFLLIASNLIEKGVYQMVDLQAKYEGTFNEIITKKNVIDILAGNDEELIRDIAINVISESYSRFTDKGLAAKVYEWLKATGNWNTAWKFAVSRKSDKILKNERISSLMYLDQPVTMQECPSEIKYDELKEQAREVGIKITSPPQKKDVLYSLIQHVRDLETVPEE